MNEGYLDFGVGMPPVFGWQATLGGPFGLFVLMAFGFPLIAFLTFYWLGDGWGDGIHALRGVFDYGFPIAVGGGGFAFFMLSLPRWQAYAKLKKVVPTRFNRQRREVCFVPKDEQEPIFVPWEELVAWVTEAQGVTEYGVQHQYGFGIGFYHPKTGKKYTLEFQTFGLPHAISTWEAIRAYMEYEVHTLKEIQDPLDLQGPDDPPWEGVHVFRNARKRLHDEYRAGKRGVFYLMGWYLYHLMTFWTLPNRLVEWEVRQIRRMNQKALPEAMAAWSKPLPEGQWARPSEELRHQSRRVLELRKANPNRPVTEIFAQVTAECEPQSVMQT